jgi:2-dehydro-3-deoxygalactonokinase
MASSSIGIKALPYVKLPLLLTPDNLFIAGLSNHQQEMALVSGIRTEEEVLRGEETILLGMSETFSEGLVVLPGTHSKQVILAGGQLVDFRTFMTGELFELLWKQSTLSATVNPMADSFHKQAFLDGLEESGTGHLLNLIFHARTRQLLKQIPGEINFDWLSGLLIGAEIRSLPADPQKIILIAEGTLRERYLLAIEKIFPDRILKCLDADACLVQGHCRLFEQIRMRGA